MQTAGFSFRRAATDWPLLLFLLSAIGGVLIAYNPSAAWPRFWGIVGGLALYVGFAHTRARAEQIRFGRWNWSPLSVVLGSLPTLVGIYFLLTNNWASRIGKLLWLDPVLRWFSTWQSSLAGYGLNSNVIGGVIAAFIPMQVAALIGNRSPSRVWIGAVLIGLSAFGLLLSESRGAWLALAIAGGGWGLWELVSQRVVNQRQAKIAWAAMVATGGLAFVLALITTPVGDRLLNLRTDRLDVWRNSLDLASDYPFTGLGLGGFTMAYSSYVLLVHVPHTIHAHNLFLDIWLEQGLLGLLALGGLMINAIWPNGPASRWRLAALASLCVLLLHGLTDDAFYGYGGQAIPLLFLPLAILVRPSQTPAMMSGAQPTQLRPTLVFGGMAVVLLMIVSLSPGARAMWEANLGALAQTQAELSLYSNEQWGMQDVLRRSPKLSLTPAIAHYQAALARDPTDAIANRRMGQIELSLGQYDTARRHLEVAYATAPSQRATRQMLGECYAIAGEIEQAVALWRTVDMGQGQMSVRESWYSYLGEQEKTAGIAQAAAALNRR